MSSHWLPPAKIISVSDLEVEYVPSLKKAVAGLNVVDRVIFEKYKKEASHFEFLKEEHLYKRISHKILDNEALVLIALNTNGLQYPLISARLKEKPGLLGLAFKKSRLMVCHAPGDWRLPLDYYRKAITEDSLVYSRLPEDLKCNHELALLDIAAGTGSRPTPWDFPAQLKSDRSFLQKAIETMEGLPHQNGFALKNVTALQKMKAEAEAAALQQVGAPPQAQACRKPKIL